MSAPDPPAPGRAPPRRHRQSDPTTEDRKPPDAGERPETDSRGAYPLDATLIRTETPTIEQAMRRLRTGRYVMDPDFHANFRWDEGTQAKLIESILRRIPLPAFYFAEDDQGRTIVVDGLRRLSTISRFLADDLRLGLPACPELRGRRFADLPQKLRNRITDFGLVCQVIAHGTPERVRLDILELVNSGAPLTRQQMRNSLYSGAGTRFLRKHAAGAAFREAAGDSLDSKTMRDREFIHRFCAFRLRTPARYRGDMDVFLAETLAQMNDLDETQLSTLGEAFDRALENNRPLFGRHAFRMHSPGQDRRGILDAPLWEVMTTALADDSEARVRTRKTPLRAAFFSLLGDEDFVRSLTHSTDSTEQVARRFADAHRVLRAAFDG